MKLKEVKILIDGNVICGNEFLDREINYAFASDLMSDVLTVQKDNLLLLTGLSNMQAIRTAEMSDIPCVIFVRNKKINQDIISLAKENEIVIIECKVSMFKASGILFNAGVKPIF